MKCVCGYEGEVFERETILFRTYVDDWQRTVLGMAIVGIKAREKEAPVIICPKCGTLKIEVVSDER